jgi:hypothetical protein
MFPKLTLCRPCATALDSPLAYRQGPPVDVTLAVALATAVATAVAVALAAAVAAAATSPPFLTFWMAIDVADAAALADCELASELEMAVDVTVPAMVQKRALSYRDRMHAWCPTLLRGWASCISKGVTTLEHCCRLHRLHRIKTARLASLAIVLGIGCGGAIAGGHRIGDSRGAAQLLRGDGGAWRRACRCRRRHLRIKQQDSM